MTAALLDPAAALLCRAAFGAASLLRPLGLSILIFHRVLPAPEPLLPGEMDAGRFDAVARMLKRNFRVLPLGQAVDLLEQGRLPTRALVITFDDGYADNAEVALPILRAYGLVATFFVSTGFLDGGRMFNDTVIEAVRASRRDAVDLGEFGLGRAPLSTVDDRRAVIAALLPVVKYLAPVDRGAAIERIHAAMGRPPLPAGPMMRRSQIQDLYRAGMEIGAHTVNHPILTTLPSDAAEAEIVGGKVELEAIIDAPVRVMAYPNGRPRQDYAREHVEMVRRVGFRAVVTTAPGSAQPGDDVFQLPRFTPWDRSLSAWPLRLLQNQWRRASLA